MRVYVLLIICGALLGCASSGYLASSKMEKLDTNIDQLKVGMDYDEIVAVMGTDIMVGHKKSIVSDHILEPITLRQPYFQEVVKKNGKSYNILYYLTSVQKPEYVVFSNETTPVILENESVIGIGHKMADRLRKP